MLGYEPPAPKLWKAVLGAALFTFPILYIANIAIPGHRPLWAYVVVASVLSFVLGRQMYRKGPGGLKNIPMGYRACTAVPVGSLPRSMMNRAQRIDRRNVTRLCL